jgi:phage tail sheath protein FI
VVDELGLNGPDARNAAVYFPRLLAADPLLDNQIEVFPPSGAVAGVMARTDAQAAFGRRPQGSTLPSSASRTSSPTSPKRRTGSSIPAALTASARSRSLVAWCGARTLRGADQLADEYKYLPVRRLALFI